MEAMKMKNKAVKSLIAILAAALLLSGCSTKMKKLTDERVNELKVGETIMFSDDEKQSIEYRWRYLISDESIIGVSTDKVKDTSGFNVKPGGDSALREIVFSALAPGECVVTLRYGRIGEEWDSDFSIEYVYTTTVAKQP